MQIIKYVSVGTQMEARTVQVLEIEILIGCYSCRERRGETKTIAVLVIMSSNASSCLTVNPSPPPPPSWVGKSELTTHLFSTPAASLLKQVCIGAEERVRLKFVTRTRLQLAGAQRLPVVIDRWRRLDVAPVELDGRDERQGEQQHGQQLAEAPLLLALVGEGHRGPAKGRGQQHDADGRADGDGRQDEQAADLDRLVPALRAAVHVPGGHGEDDAVADDDGNGADVRRDAGGAGRLAKGRRAVPDAGDGQRGARHAAGDDLHDEDARHAREGKVDEHEQLAQPAQDPVAAVVAGEGQQRRVVRGHGQQRQHPDEEEVVRHQRVHLGQPDRLDADALHDLRVAVPVEELAPDGGGPPADLGGHDAGGEGERDDGGDHEGEKDLDHTPAPATPASLGASDGALVQLAMGWQSISTLVKRPRS
ncbi:hypothetical protein IF2G_04077 [Cordyceps javanica]|nr:hypothetical protein IF2G_04077 [Cordyceps javanica]